MLPILQNQSDKKMSLKEITDLIGVRHDKACLKVLSMAEEPEFGTVSIVDIVYNDKGQTIQTYMLDKRQSVAVAARLNTALLMRVIDRWQELEQKQSQPESPLLQLANAVLTAQAIIADQSQKLLIAEPKAAALDLIAGSDDSRCIRDTAKDLKIKPSRLTQYLLANRWIYRQSRDDAKLGKVMAYQHRIDQGLIEHCSVVIEQKGQTRLATSVKITGKGFANLSLAFSGESK